MLRRRADADRDRGRSRAARVAAKWRSTSPTPGSAAPTCTSCTARWTHASRCRRCSVTRCRARSRRSATGLTAGRRAIASRSCRSPGAEPARRAAPGTSTSATTSIFSASTRRARCRPAGRCPRMCSSRCRDSLSLADGALAEPAAVAVHDVSRAGLREGERALVVGGGPIGLLIASVASARRRRGARARAQRIASRLRE